MTMIRPKIRGLKVTNGPKGKKEEAKIGQKGKGKFAGEFLGTQNQVR